MRNCKNSKCSKDINNKHKNAKFCSPKCKDHFHNTTNNKRLVRAKQYSPKKQVIIQTDSLSRLLDRKIAQMDTFMCVDQD